MPKAMGIIQNQTDVATPRLYASERKNPRMKNVVRISLYFMLLNPDILIIVI
jgi:hypothetical protein